MRQFKAYIMLLFLGIIAFFYFKTDPNEVDFLLSCPLYANTGLFCPGCGSQRALHNLLHLDLLKAINNNLLLIIAMLLMIYHYGVLAVNKLFNWPIKSLFSNSKFRLLLIIFAGLFWIFRNISVYPFSLLAPIN